ncbi:MAG: PQQ-binding-like beta-propeller repeat protein [Thermoplasmatales archaeon]|nr:PQQ-binding-like beta-propeller repeat protein [Candidatus Thermoplasmatota archaeon]MCG2827261.1 PQQ-binding-like beta-propeller repeat protein [Thermoplasmatales archaeon]
MKTSKIAIAIILFALIPLAVPNGSSAENVKSTTSDWSMFRHDLSHTGYSDSPAPDTNELMWGYSTEGSVGSSAAIVNGKVFIGGYDNNVYCLDENTGNIIWTYKANYLLFPSPAVADGKVFIGSRDTYLYCLAEETGNKIWDYKTDGDIASSPAVVDGMVFFGSSDYKVYCLNEDSGNLVWSQRLGTFTEGLHGGVRSSPSIVDGKVYVGSYDDNLYCLDENDGGIIWQYKTGDNVYSSPTVWNDKVFFGSMDNKVYCLDKDNGDLIWSYGTGDEIWSSTAVANGKMFIGSKDGYLYCLNANNGALIWKYKTEGEIYSSPSVADSMVYVGSADNALYCLDEDTGGLIWKYVTEDTVWSSPAIAHGRVIIGSYDGKIYCFGSPPTKVTLHESADITTNSVSLSWTENQDDDFAKYEIHQSIISGFSPNETTLIKIVTSQSTTSYTVTNLSSSTTYYFTIRVVNTKGICKDSNEITINTLNAPPIINILDPSNNEIVSGIITVSGNTSDDVGVQLVQINIDNNSWKDLSGKENWEYKIDTNTLSNGKHTIYVRAYDGEYYDEKSITVNVKNEGQSKISVFGIVVFSVIAVLVVVCGVSVLFLRKRKEKMPPEKTVEQPYKMFVEKTAPVTAKCPKCGNIMKITSAKRPLKIKCTKCGTRSILR